MPGSSSGLVRFFVFSGTFYIKSKPIKPLVLYYFDVGFSRRSKFFVPSKYNYLNTHANKQICTNTNTITWPPKQISAEELVPPHLGGSTSGPTASESGCKNGIVTTISFSKQNYLSFEHWIICTILILKKKKFKLVTTLQTSWTFLWNFPPSTSKF